MGAQSARPATASVPTATAALRERGRPHSARPSEGNGAVVRHFPLSYSFCHTMLISPRGAAHLRPPSGSVPADADAADGGRDGAAVQAVGRCMERQARLRLRGADRPPARRLGGPGVPPREATALCPRHRHPPILWRRGARSSSTRRGGQPARCPWPAATKLRAPAANRASTEGICRTAAGDRGRAGLQAQAGGDAQLGAEHRAGRRELFTGGGRMGWGRWWLHGPPAAARDSSWLGRGGYGRRRPMP